jgi:hypothetical protein
MTVSGLSYNPLPRPDPGDAPPTTGGPLGRDPAAAAVSALLAATTTAHLAAWADRWGPSLDQSRVPLSAIYAAHSSPLPSPHSCLLLAKNTLWIVTVDDLAEHDSAALPTLDHLRLVAGGHPPDPRLPLAGALADIRDAVRTAPQGPTFYSWWEQAAKALIDGMRYERVTTARRAEGAAAPPLGDYLAHAKDTIGLPMAVTAMWSVGTNEPRGNDLAALRDSLMDAALALRLANDLQSHGRENSTRDLNAVALGVASDELTRMITTAASRCHRRLQPLIARSCEAARVLSYHLVYSLRLYQDVDAAHLADLDPFFHHQ